MEFRCRTCGFRSFKAWMFVEESRNGRSGRCIACGPALSKAGADLQPLIWVAAGLIPLASALIGRPHTVVGLGWLFAASLLPAACLTSITHEIGHALATWAVGGRVLGIVIGSGRTVWRLPTPLFTLEIASNPLWGGRIRHRLGDSSSRRWKEGVILAGGAAANLLADLALFAVLGWLEAGRQAGEPWSVAMMTVLALAVAQTFSAVMNLWPWTFERDGEMLATDGGRLLRLFGQGG